MNDQIQKKSSKLPVILMAGCILMIIIILIFSIIGVGIYYFSSKDNNNEKKENNVEAEKENSDADEDLKKELEELGIEVEEGDGSGECTEEFINSIIEDGEITPDDVALINSKCEDELNEDSFSQLDKIDQERRESVFNNEDWFDLGEKFSAGGFDVTVLEAKNLGSKLEQSEPCEGENDRDCLPKDCSAKSGKIYINLKMEVKSNLSKKKIIASTPIINENFELFYETSKPFCEYERQKISDSEFDPGETKELYMLFEVDENSKQIIFEFHDSDFVDPSYGYVYLSDIL